MKQACCSCSPGSLSWSLDRRQEKNPRGKNWRPARPRKDHRGVDLISDALPFGRLWYLEVSDAIGYAQHRSRSHDAVIRVYDAAGNVIETHEQAVASSGDFWFHR